MLVFTDEELAKSSGQGLGKDASKADIGKAPLDKIKVNVCKGNYILTGKLCRVLPWSQMFSFRVVTFC